MFKRLFWLVVGLGLGFGLSWWMTRTVRRAVDKLTPEHVAGALGGRVRDLGRRLRAALDEGRQAMRERELEIRASLEPGAPLPSQLYPGQVGERLGVVYLPPGDERARARRPGDDPSSPARERPGGGRQGR